MVLFLRLWLNDLFFHNFIYSFFISAIIYLMPIVSGAVPYSSQSILRELTI